MDEDGEESSQNDNGTKDHKLTEVTDKNGLEDLSSHLEFQTESQSLGQLEFYIIVGTGK